MTKDGYTLLAQSIFGRDEISKVERSWVKHQVIGSAMFRPGGPYGGPWKGEGPSPFDRAIQHFKGAAGWAAFKTWYIEQLQKSVAALLTLVEDADTDAWLGARTPAEIKTICDRAKLLLEE